MNLQDRIKNDLVAAMKAKDEETKNALRVIMGEFGRQAQKELSDDDVINIIKKMAKSEKEVMEKTGAVEPTPFLKVTQSYLPQMASEDEIRAWIETHKTWPSETVS